MSDLAHPNAPGASAPMGAEPVGAYERKTQSPTIWCVYWKVSLGVWVWHGNRFDLHKSEMPANVYTWFDCGDAHHVRDIYMFVFALWCRSSTAYVDDAKKLLGELNTNAR